MGRQGQNPPLPGATLARAGMRLRAIAPLPRNRGSRTGLRLCRPLDRSRLESGTHRLRRWCRRVVSQVERAGVRADTALAIP